MMTRGRIGVARRVHYLKAHAPGAGWASSWCDDWAGAVQVTTDEVTCHECRVSWAIWKMSFDGPYTTVVVLKRGKPCPKKAPKSLSTSCSYLRNSC